MIRGAGKIPVVALRRLCAIYQRLEDLELAGQPRVTSSALALDLGTSAASVRRDIGLVGELGPSPTGYEVRRLKQLLGERTGLGRCRRACVVGLNWLGQALVVGWQAEASACSIVAAFDSNTNRLETTRARVPLFPTYEIEEVVRRHGVEVAIVASAEEISGETMARLARGGAKGVLNLTGRSLGPPVCGLIYTGLALANELRFLSAVLHIKEEFK